MSDPQPRVEHLHTAPVPEAPVEERESVEALAGQGLRGDRNCAEGAPPDGQVTLVEAEAIEALAREHGISLAPGGTRRNVTTRGVRLNDLVGKTFRVGDATLRGVELCEPCRHLEKMTGEKLIPGLTHRGGLRAEVVSGGVIRRGDPITAAAPVASTGGGAAPPAEAPG